jgi:hypothetical protein
MKQPKDTKETRRDRKRIYFRPYDKYLDCFYRIKKQLNLTSDDDVFEWLLQIADEKISGQVSTYYSMMTKEDSLMDRLAKLEDVIHSLATTGIQPIQPQGVNTERALEVNSEQISKLDIATQDEPVALAPIVSNLIPLPQGIVEYLNKSLDEVLLSNYKTTYQNFVDNYTTGEFTEGQKGLIKGIVNKYNAELLLLLMTHCGNKDLCEELDINKNNRLYQYLYFRYTKLQLPFRVQSLWSLSLSDLHELLSALPKYTAINNDQLHHSNPQVFLRMALGSQYSWVFGGKPSDYTFITF